MISAILRGNPWLVPAFLVSGLILGALMFFVARKRGLSRPLAVLLGVAAAGEIVATLYPSHASAATSGTCWINRDPLTPLLTQQGLMNVAMYVPLAFLAVAVFRRPAVVTSCCILLSAGTELTQALIPHVGRSCTSEDLVANSLGSVLGAAAAVFIHRRKEAKGSTEPKTLNKRDFSRAANITLGGTILFLVIGSMSVTPVLTEVSELTRASSGQEDQAKKMVENIYGSKAKISSIQYMKGQGGQADQILVTLEDGFVNFTTPEDFVTGSTLAESLPGVTNRPVETDDEATRQATSFVQSRFPWALKASKPMVDPTVAGTGQKTVGWRQRVEGVLMPMRMDVVVEPNGRISAFTGRNEPGPSVPPSHKLTAAQAQKIAGESVPNGKYDSSEILVQKNKQGKWETRWAVNFTLPAAEASEEEVPVQQGASVVIHAETGKVIEVNYGDSTS
ncbi:VanZ family protein [Streptomyces sp. NPDC097727]|uniref:VanZ family protein n=1 Tax=Streptomyces sp. NPDC097727 TaxID=3366092 RepID=UPI0038274142